MRYRQKSLHRETHKAPKNWAVVDLQKFERLVAEGRDRGTLTDHDGQCLEKLEYQVRVAFVQGAYSSSQARLFAANGGNRWALDKRTVTNGQTPARHYRDRTKYAAVELEMLAYLRRQSRIDWNLDAVRQAMFEERGEKVLWSLCTSFIPRDSSPEQMALNVVAEKTSSAQELGSLRKRNDRPKTFKPTVQRAYCVVDVVDYRERLTDAYQERGLPVGGVKFEVPEGEILRQATSAQIQAPDWLRAVDKFRLRVQGPYGILPRGRYVAVTQGDWEILVTLKTLPAKCTREDLSAAALQTRRSRKTKRLSHNPGFLRSQWWKPGWWREPESGWDAEAFCGQQVLVGLLSRKELLAFPLPDDSASPFLPQPVLKPMADILPAGRRWKPRYKVRRQLREQLALPLPPPSIKPHPLRLIDPHRPAQLVLISSVPTQAPRLREASRSIRIQVATTKQALLDFTSARTR